MTVCAAAAAHRLHNVVDHGKPRLRRRMADKLAFIGRNNNALAVVSARRALSSADTLDYTAACSRPASKTFVNTQPILKVTAADSEQSSVLRL